jgi:hypothetical protein
MSSPAGPEHKYEKRLMQILASHILPGLDIDDPDVRDKALGMLREGKPLLPQERRERLTAVGKYPSVPPPETVKELRRTLGLVGLLRWMLETYPDFSSDPRSDLADWLLAPPFKETDHLLEAGIRSGLCRATDQDNQLIDDRVGQPLRRGTMQITFGHDPRAVPPGFDSAALEQLVRGELQGNVPTLTDSLVNFVRGAVSLDGFLTQPVSGQKRGIRDARYESEDSTKKLDGTDLLNRDAYVLIANAIQSIRSSMNSSAVGAYVEELAFVARQLIANAAAIPIDSPGLTGRVADALNEYVPGTAGATLQLPPLSGEDGVSSDLVADNIRAVALIYGAWNLEEMKLLQVLDRVVELFMVGQLPIGFDNGGKALAGYYFDPGAEQRLTEAARRMTFSRVLGVPGGEVSREAPPNTSFQDSFLRFLAAVSEYDRQRRIADVVAGGRPRSDTLSLTGEQVRKAGRDLGALGTTFAYGGTFFIAQRIATQLDTALKILSTKELLAAYGVTNAFQIVERVCQMDFGGNVPNIERLRTMALTGKEILDIVAANIPAWLGVSGRPLFFVPNDPNHPSNSGGSDAGSETGGNPLVLGGTVSAVNADIDPVTQARLSRAVEHWLAVNGIKDDDRVRLGQPEISVAAPSIPSAGVDGAGAAFDQLRQAAQSGQTLSPDQIRALLPPEVSGMVRL